MPIYEYRCNDCDETFELRRPIDEANEPAFCPVDDANGRRVLSLFATAGRGGPPMPAGGGCGGNCACAAAAARG